MGDGEEYRTVSSSGARTDSFELSDYLGVLRRRWWIVLVFACLGALAAAAYVVVAPKTYTATTAVYVSANAANANQLVGARTGGAVNMDNEAQIVQSTTVAAVVAKDLHSGLTARQLAKQVSVAVPPNTTVLEISCSARSAAGTVACTQAFASAYLAERQASAQNRIQSNIKKLQSLQRPLERQAIALTRQIAPLSSGSSLLPALRAQLADVSSKLAPLRAAVASLSASINYQAGYVITPAAAPSAPTSPRKLLYLPSGLLAGLLIGLVVAFAADRRDDRIHSARDVVRYLGLPVLFALPQRRLGWQTSLIPPRSAAGRAFADLARAVAVALGDDGRHVIVVAGTSASQSGSAVAANLAAALVRTRADVVLVCAEPDDASMTHVLGAGDGRGFAEILAGTATVGEVARQPAEAPGLSVITPGAGTATAHYWRSDVSRRVMQELKVHAEYVVIEAAADAVEALSLAEFADGAIVVVEVEATRRAAASGTIKRLDVMRTAVLGVAVWPAVAGRPGKPPAREPRPPQVGQPPVRAQDRRPEFVTEPISRAESGEPVSKGAARRRRSADDPGEP
jgi:succinoglycan biosynthesis transport protein ExoP